MSAGKPRVWSASTLLAAEAVPCAPRFARYFTAGSPDECWLWTGSLNRQGYGRFHVGYGREADRNIVAPRVAWVLHTGRDLPASLSIDHLCSTPLCVNPAHLEPVNIHENRRRARAKVGSPEVVERCIQALLLVAEVGGGRTPRGGVRRICPLCGESYGTDYFADHLRRELVAGGNYRARRVDLAREAV